MSGPAQRLGVSANWPCTLVVQYGVGSPIDTGSPISTGLPTTGPGATDIELYKDVCRTFTFVRDLVGMRDGHLTRFGNDLRPWARKWQSS